MLLLERIHTTPEIFKPVLFSKGVNLILGEKSDNRDKHGEKVNGVGKSLFVEFLHFALCRKLSDTRLSKIPAELLPEDVIVHLDLTLNHHKVRISRSLHQHEHPVLTVDGKQTTMDSLADAQDLLGE